MFNLFRSKQPEVLKYDHWIFEQFECSPSEFYDSIEEELKTSELPGLIIERIDHRETYVFSDKRQYLRIRRERLLFDVCLAPFGTYWFFSRRYSLIRYALSFLEIILMIAFLVGGSSLYATIFGAVFGSCLFGATLISLGIFLHSVLSLGWHYVDAFLLQIPLFGNLYAVLFRRETYYREDTRAAYLGIVDALLKRKLDELTAEKGVNLVAYKDATPPSHPAVLQMIGELLRIAG